MRFCTCIHVPVRMNCNDFSDLTFHIQLFTSWPNTNRTNEIPINFVFNENVSMLTLKPKMENVVNTVPAKQKHVIVNMLATTVVWVKNVVSTAHSVYVKCYVDQPTGLYCPIVYFLCVAFVYICITRRDYYGGKLTSKWEADWQLPVRINDLWAHIIHTITKKCNFWVWRHN